MVNNISIPIEGIENVLLRVIWHEVVTEASTGREIEAVWLTSPVKSADVLATIAEMEMGVGDDAETKLIHLRVYVKLLLRRLTEGQS